ncbi:MAG TPA: dihydrodipicolinate synthase family protein, partial [Chitinophagaceae bacterium]|nr:dihydrodipicolinate synthase family protein [Chitinophagaceae bacterium]
RDKPADFLVVSGDDALTLPQIACGMEGIISVAANSFPKTFSEMVRHCLKSDFKSAKALNDKLIAGYELLFAENNPAGVKAALAELGLIGNYLRLPVVPVSKELQKKIKQFVASL